MPGGAFVAALVSGVVLAATSAAYSLDLSAHHPVAGVVEPSEGTCESMWERSDFVTGSNGSPAPEAAVRAGETVNPDETLRVLPDQGAGFLVVEVVTAQGEVRVSFTLDRFASGWVVVGARGCVFSDPSIAVNHGMPAAV